MSFLLLILFSNYLADVTFGFKCKISTYSITINIITKKLNCVDGFRQEVGDIVNCFFWIFNFQGYISRIYYDFIT